jgi:hypothetical protein
MGEPKPAKYSCDNPPRAPLSSREATTKLLEDQEFAGFIRNLLQKVNSGNAEEKERARTCLNAWYAGDPTDLTSLPIRDDKGDAAAACTDRSNIADKLCTDRPDAADKLCTDRPQDN